MVVVYLVFVVVGIISTATLVYLDSGGKELYVHQLLKVVAWSFLTFGLIPLLYLIDREQYIPKIRKAIKRQLNKRIL